MRFKYYECTAKSKACPVKSLPAADTEEYCWSHLTRELSKPNTLKTALREYEHMYSSINQDAVAKMEMAKHRLRALGLKKSIMAGFQPF